MGKTRACMQACMLSSPRPAPSPLPRSPCRRDWPGLGVQHGGRAASHWQRAHAAGALRKLALPESSHAPSLAAAYPALPCALERLGPVPGTLARLSGSCSHPPCCPPHPHPPQGNVDPMILFGTEQAIREAVTRSLVEAGPRHHILNVRPRTAGRGARPAARMCPALPGHMPQHPGSRAAPPRRDGCMRVDPG